MIPKIYTLGHRNTQGILDGEIVVQEKIDGSQFSFSLQNGALECRSKSAVINLSAPGMFKAAVDTAALIASRDLMLDGSVYQCEFLAKPKHNVLNYGRIPKSNLMIFDILTSDGVYLQPSDVQLIAATFGIEAVPELYYGDACGFPKEIQDALLQKESVLGGVKIEGFVIKNYSKPHVESKSGFLTAKVVAPEFKEKHASSPLKAKANSPVESIINHYRTEARWLKAIQHLREAGQLVNGPEDIGPLMKELAEDFLIEEKSEVAEQLFEVFGKQLVKGISNGFPQYYKALLAGGLSVWQESQLCTSIEKN